MRVKQSVRLVMLSWALAALAACGTVNQTPTVQSLAPTVAAPTSPPTAAAQASAEPAAFRPLPEADCAALRDTMAKTIDVQVTLAISDFQDFMSGAKGQGCALSASGSGKEFPQGFAATAKDLETMLAQEGWTTLPTYVADGPTGTALGMSKRNGLALIEVGWMPSAAANCPQDQPIFECKLTPEQQLYSVVVRLAQE